MGLNCDHPVRLCIYFRIYCEFQTKNHLSVFVQVKMVDRWRPRILHILIQNLGHLEWTNHLRVRPSKSYHFFCGLFGGE